MKFTYWGGIRSGKMQIWQLFELNGKKTAAFPQSGKKWPCYVILWGGEYSHILYEENGQIKTKVHRPHCFVDGVYTNDSVKQGVERHWSNDPQIFYTCFDKVFEQDLIVSPYILFGYFGSKYGKIGTREFNEMVERREPSMKVDLDYTISMLKKRRNIIPYKSDKEHEDYLFQMTSPYPERCKKIQKHSERLRILTQELLTEYDIPYEMFDLDAADYSIFGLPKPLPKSILEQDQNVGQVWSPK